MHFLLTTRPSVDIPWVTGVQISSKCTFFSFCIFPSVLNLSVCKAFDILFYWLYCITAPELTIVPNNSQVYLSSGSRSLFSGLDLFGVRLQSYSLKGNFSMQLSRTLPCYTVLKRQILLSLYNFIRKSGPQLLPWPHAAVPLSARLLHSAAVETVPYFLGACSQTLKNNIAFHPFLVDCKKHMCKATQISPQAIQKNWQCPGNNWTSLLTH